MAYTPENNPYIPGDPYSYDLKWQVDHINMLQGRVDDLDNAIQEATDQADRSEREADRSKEEADRSAQQANMSADYSDYSYRQGLKSEGFATGQQNGENVNPGSPYYENNSKYYSQQSAASAQTAADYAAHIADPVSGIVTTWLADHITQPTTPAIDTSLTVAGAAADAKAAGDKINYISDALINSRLAVADIADSVNGFDVLSLNVQNGFYYDTGSGITFTNNTAYHGAEIECSEGEVYLIDGAIPGVNGLALAFVLDSSRNLITALARNYTGNPTASYTDYMIAIPAGGAYLDISTTYGIVEIKAQRMGSGSESLRNIVDTVTYGNSPQIKADYQRGFVASDGSITTSNYAVLNDGYMEPSQGLSFLMTDDVIIMPVRYTLYQGNWQIESYPNQWYNADTIANYIAAVPFAANRRYKIMIQFKDQHQMSAAEVADTNWNYKVRFIDGSDVYTAVDVEARAGIQTISNNVDLLAEDVDLCLPWKGKNILSIGDSYAYLNYFGPYLAAKTGCTQRGRGWNGGYICYAVADQYSQGSGFIQEPFDSTLLAPYDIITVTAGTNNYGYGPSLLGNISDPVGTGLDSDSVYSQLKYVIEKILTIKPTIQIVFCTQPYRLEFTGQPTGGKEANNRGYTMQDVANAIKEVCNYYAIPCYDFHGSGGWNEYTIGLPHQQHDFTNNPLTYDGLHPRDGLGNGAYLLGVKLGAFINNLK